jgi:hypothetical protein
MSKIVNIIIVILIILTIAGGAYWYFFIKNAAPQVTITTEQQTNTGFVPLNRTTSSTQGQTVAQGNATMTTASTTTNIIKRIAPLPVLRVLSATPIGGYGASTTATTTTVRWIDRGRGNIYEARGDLSDITTISNTLLPRVYESIWNKNNTSFIGQYLDDSNNSTTIIANVLKRATASTTAQISETAYELKGKTVSGNIIAIETSPKRDRVLIVNNENNHAVGYISNFDGSKQTQLFDLPFNQIKAEWPEENTIAITTKASSNYSGYLYFINVKTGASKKIIGDIQGLITKVSKDATKVLYSSATGNNDLIKTAIYDIKSQKTTDVIFRTLADKCVWSSKFKEQVYCGVPSKIITSVYPDDWYLGKISFIDSIWLLNSKTSEVHRVVDLLNQGNALIDAFNLQLDNTDDFLFFMNKNDLSLWSIDLVSSN